MDTSSLGFDSAWVSTELGQAQARRIAPLVRQLENLSAEDQRVLSKALTLLPTLTDGVLEGPGPC